MFLERIRYELRLMGLWVIVTPLLTMGVFVLFTLIFHLLGADPARMLVGGLEMLLPLLAGIVVATLLSQDRAIEIQLTLPHRYSFTILQRLILIILWTACVGIISTSLIALLKLAFLPMQIRQWSVLPQFLSNQLTWLSPLLWFTTIGLMLALLIHSRAASTALLCGIWFVEILAHADFATTSWLQPLYLFPATLSPEMSLWLLNRFEVIGLALLFLLVTWLLLRHPERLLKTAGEE